MMNGSKIGIFFCNFVQIIFDVNFCRFYILICYFLAISNNCTSSIPNFLATPLAIQNIRLRCRRFTRFNQRDFPTSIENIEEDIVNSL